MSQVGFSYDFMQFTHQNGTWIALNHTTLKIFTKIAHSSSPLHWLANFNPILITLPNPILILFHLNEISTMWGNIMRELTDKEIELFDTQRRIPALENSASTVKKTANVKTASIHPAYTSRSAMKVARPQRHRRSPRLGAEPGLA